ncbi:phosphorylase [Tolypothrix sp. PCC 7910]|nr:phosphorylase [Tolypothrix sp. PCC 7910]QIR41193.1 phosphorylase [Tolypothrix sp. PCC 7910]
MTSIILVPQGAEYKAVCRGLSTISSSTPKVIPIPVGIKPLTIYLRQLQANGTFLNYPETRVLIMGLCGSLSPQYPVGKIVLYENCIYQEKVQECDRTFTAQLHSAISNQQSAPSLVKGVTSDRVICAATEKRHLGDTLGGDVVDMEGFAALEFFHPLGISVAMLRVVSDDCNHDIPNLSSAISADGSLKPLPLAITLLRQPFAATNLIRGSLKALKVLEQIPALLFSA